MNTKALSIMILGVFLITWFAPTTSVFAQEDNWEEVKEEALIDLLNELWGTENDQLDDTPAPQEEEEPTPEPTPAPEPTVEDAPEEQKAEWEEHEAAEDILDLLGGKFEYAGPEVIEVPLATIDDTSVVIKTTKILYDGNPIEEYRVYYSTNTIADFLDVNDLKEMDLEVENTVGNTVELSLDGLDATTTYYLIVAPVDPTDPTADPLDLISEEVRFTTKAPVPVAMDPMPTEPSDTWVNGMYVKDVSYTYADNKATVVWDAEPQAQTVALSIKKSNSTEYTKLADVPATAWKYTFTVQEGGLHLLKIETKNANGEVFGKEQIQSIKIDEVIAPEAPVVTAPQVGPTQNLMIALIFLAVMTGVGYNYRKQEA